jgi:outer membrane protein assembly factor BamB
MNDVKELLRKPSPGGLPQPLAYRDKTLWVGAWDTDKIYAVDPATWKVLDEIGAPGKPYGMAALGDEIRVVVSIGADDDRYLYRFVPGKGFDEASKTPCPDFTGSHLAAGNGTLYLLQMGLKRILAFDERGAIAREIALPTRCGGIGVRDGAFYMISADEEFDNLTLATLDVELDSPQAVAVATLNPEARALTFDGSAWWTSYREQNEIVSFAV